MITLTIAPNCVSASLASTEFNVTNQSVTLTIKYNCTKEYEISISPSATSYTILPASLQMVDYLSDGIYGITLRVVKQNGDIVTETMCKLMDCVSSCTLVESFKSLAICSECLLQALAFNALKVAESCTSCDCETMCTLYNTVYQKDCKTQTTNVTSCGCS